LTKAIATAQPVDRLRGFHAHHLVARRFSHLIGVHEDDIIAVALSPRLHNNVGGMGVHIDSLINNVLRRIGAVRHQETLGQVWIAHREVYHDIGYPEWADAIYDAYFSKRGVPYS
jgi:hypothetical protein